MRKRILNISRCSRGHKAKYVLIMFNTMSTECYQIFFSSLKAAKYEMCTWVSPAYLYNEAGKQIGKSRMREVTMYAKD